jgi:hypothetical protein
MLSMFEQDQMYSCSHKRRRFHCSVCDSACCGDCIVGDSDICTECHDVADRCITCSRVIIDGCPDTCEMNIHCHCLQCGPHYMDSPVCIGCREYVDEPRRYVDMCMDCDNKRCRSCYISEREDTQRQFCYDCIGRETVTLYLPPDLLRIVMDFANPKISNHLMITHSPVRSIKMVWSDRDRLNLFRAIYAEHSRSVTHVSAT